MPDYIELKYETEWKHPIQAYAFARIKGKLTMYHHFFAEWDTFEEAIEWLKYGHKCPIIINKQTKIGILA